MWQAGPACVLFGNMPQLSTVRGVREDKENGGITAGSVAQDFARAPAPRVAFFQKGTDRLG